MRTRFLALVAAATVAALLTLPEPAAAWVTCDDGVMRDAGACPGPAGPRGGDGRDGVDGQDGRDGIDGQDGVDGVDGRDGMDGTDGRDGIDGQDGRDGRDGLDALPDWSAMAIAAAGIPYTDAPVSAGLGLGAAGGKVALALGVSVRLQEDGRFTAAVMRTSDEIGLSAGLAFGF